MVSDVGFDEAGPGRIVIVSGATGSGKTSVSRLLAEHSTFERAVHIHTDDFYQYIRKGYTEPWLKESGDQNETVVEAATASAGRFSAGGYEVFVDGVIGPWFLGPWLRLARKGVDVRYIVLRPDEKTTVLRAAEREQNLYFPLTGETVKQVWRSLADLGAYEAHAIDTGAQTIEESVALIQTLLLKKNFRLV